MSHHKPKHGTNNPPPGKKQAEGNEKSTNHHVYLEPGVQIDLVQDLKKTYESGQSNNATHNNKQLFWAKISAGLILGYVLLTLLVYCANKRAADAAKKAADIAGDTLA